MLGWTNLLLLLKTTENEKVTALLYGNYLSLWFEIIAPSGTVPRNSPATFQIANLSGITLFSDYDQNGNNTGFYETEVCFLNNSGEWEELDLIDHVPASYSINKPVGFTCLDLQFTVRDIYGRFWTEYGSACWQ